MLLLRCSLLADSISRSISHWPSTMATRSSSAWVALNSMRFMIVFPARVRPGVGGAKRHRAGFPRGVTLSCGGRYRCRPRAQLPLRCDENRPDARRAGRGGGLDGREALRSRGCDGLRQCVQAVRHQSADAARVRGPDSLMRNSSPTAPRNAPLRTDLRRVRRLRSFLYHPYFSGAQRPDGQWI